MKTLLGEHLHFDWKIVTVIVVSTLLLRSWIRIINSRRTKTMMASSFI